MSELKKVLIITYYWPPSAGGGVQRWLKFSKYLPEYGWQPIIFTPENPHYALQDKSLLADIAPELTVIKCKIWEPYSLLKIFGKSSSNANTGHAQKQGAKQKILSWVRGNLLIPDPRKFWIKPSVEFLKKYLVEHKIDTIITTGPPHSMHLIGLGLKEHINVKWIADFRDPWSKFDLLDHYYIHAFRRKKYTALERQVLDKCDKVLATSPSMKDQLVPFDTQKFQAIANGYDQTDFANYSDTSVAKDCLIYNAGLISALRNPVHLWSALDTLITHRSEEDTEIKLKLVGTIESEVVQSLESNAALKSVLSIEKYKPHEAVLVDYQKANVLLLLVNNTENATVNIPGKTFEYLATKKPIICMSKSKTDVWNILEAYPHVLLLKYSETTEQILPKLKLFLKKSIQVDIDTSAHARRHLTSILAETLNCF